MGELGYLILWIVLFMFNLFIGKHYISDYFDTDDKETKKKCAKEVFEIIMVTIYMSVFLAMLIIKSHIGGS